MHNYKMGEEDVRGKSVGGEGGVKKFSCQPPIVLFFFFWNRPYIYEQVKECDQLEQSPVLELLMSFSSE